MARELQATIVSLSAFPVAELCTERKHNTVSVHTVTTVGTCCKRKIPCALILGDIKEVALLEFLPCGGTLDPLLASIGCDDRDQVVTPPWCYSYTWYESWQHDTILVD